MFLFPWLSVAAGRDGPSRPQGWAEPSGLAAPGGAGREQRERVLCLQDQSWEFLRDAGLLLQLQGIQEWFGLEGPEIPNRADSAPCRNSRVSWTNWISLNALITNIPRSGVGDLIQPSRALSDYFPGALERRNSTSSCCLAAEWLGWEFLIVLCGPNIPILLPDSPGSEDQTQEQLSRE